MSISNLDFLNVFLWVQKCSNGKAICLKTNFNKHENRKDGLKSVCKTPTKNLHPLDFAEHFQKAKDWKKTRRR